MIVFVIGFACGVMFGILILSLLFSAAEASQ
jgi:hypothetical protein